MDFFGASRGIFDRDAVNRAFDETPVTVYMGSPMRAGIARAASERGITVGEFILRAVSAELRKKDGK